MKITVKGLAYDKCSVNDSYDDEGGGGVGREEGKGREGCLLGRRSAEGLPGTPRKPGDLEIFCDQFPVKASL